LEECGTCLVFASFTLEFASELRKKDEKTSVWVAEELPKPHTLQNPHTHTYTHTHIHTHTPTHIKNNLKPSQYKLKQTQYKMYPNELVTV
jgi:hypothetical protein